MSWFKRSNQDTFSHSALTTSILYDETTFYKQFTRDLSAAEKEVIIESPFISSKRMNCLKPVFERLIQRDVKIFVFTRDPKEHSEEYEIQSENEIGGVPHILRIYSEIN